MKVTRIAYTEYPISSEECELRKIHVDSYDNNKYCNVRAYREDGTLEGEVHDIKIGYIFMDPLLTRRPNSKTSSTWGGAKREPKRRMRKTTFYLCVDMKEHDGERVNDFRYFSTFEAAYTRAAVLLINYPDIKDICIAARVVYRGSRGSGFSTGDDCTYMNMYKGKPCVFWRDRWNRYFGRKNRDNCR